MMYFGFCSCKCNWLQLIILSKEYSENFLTCTQMTCLNFWLKAVLHSLFVFLRCSVLICFCYQQWNWVCLMCTCGVYKHNVYWLPCYFRVLLYSLSVFMWFTNKCDTWVGLVLCLYLLSVVIFYWGYYRWKADVIMSLGCVTVFHCWITAVKNVNWFNKACAFY